MVCAIQAASLKDSTDAAEGADLEAQPMSRKRRRAEDAAEENEAQPKPKKRVRWADEALDQPISVCQASTNCSKACLWEHLLLVPLGEYKLHDDLPEQNGLHVHIRCSCQEAHFCLCAYITSSRTLHTACAWRGIYATDHDMQCAKNASTLFYFERKCIYKTNPVTHFMTS